MESNVLLGIVSVVGSGDGEARLHPGGQPFRVNPSGDATGCAPRVVTVGELKATSLGAAERYRCSCGTLIKECHFWRRISDEMASRGYPFDLTATRMNILDLNSRYAERLLRPLHRGALMEWIRDRALNLSADWRKHLAETQQRNLALIETLGRVAGARVVVDSSKIGLRLKYLLRIPSIDIRVVRLIRDGRGVALTYINPSEFADAADENRRGGGSGLSDTIEQYRGLDMRSGSPGVEAKQRGSRSCVGWPSKLSVARGSLRGSLRGSFPNTSQHLFFCWCRCQPDRSRLPFRRPSRGRKRDASRSHFHGASRRALEDGTERRAAPGVRVCRR